MKRWAKWKLLAVVLALSAIGLGLGIRCYVLHRRGGIEVRVNNTTKHTLTNVQLSSRSNRLVLGAIEGESEAVWHFSHTGGESSLVLQYNVGEAKVTRDLDVYFEGGYAGYIAVEITDSGV